NGRPPRPEVSGSAAQLTPSFAPRCDVAFFFRRRKRRCCFFARQRPAAQRGSSVSCRNVGLSARSFSEWSHPPTNIGAADEEELNGPVNENERAAVEEVRETG